MNDIFYRTFQNTLSLYHDTPDFVSDINNTQDENAWPESLKYSSFRHLNTIHTPLTPPPDALSDFPAHFHFLISTMPLKYRQIFANLIHIEYPTQSAPALVIGDAYVLFEIFYFEKTAQSLQFSPAATSPENAFFLRKQKISGRSAQLFVRNFVKNAPKCVVYVNWNELAELQRGRLGACLAVLGHQFRLESVNSGVRKTPVLTSALVDSEYFSRLEEFEMSRRLSVYGHEIAVWVGSLGIALGIILIVELLAFLGAIGVTVQFKNQLTAKGL
ncbi:hypothetical protein SS50377_20471 [Spironucleus salmonicida]|uniref:Uncharacterized protein n=1 Tax=Spironucleus salmonicida TaxID=348837 RepID=V6LLN8_9EUKA|nr:hypothetical protein SS50377_20471 [Spironucleus salmonicida]|eukprot:EST45620.1 Hypothetical protein SS50377_14477 [Spironucleus salmonicida]